jgi:methionyl-tRNA formyltransferase
VTYCVAARRSGYEAIVARLKKETGQRIVLIKDKKQLSIRRLEALRPRYIFFPHWSEYVPAAIYQAYECVIFHMTDVPFGRGGTPLQNLISRGIYKTKISALRCGAVVDGGPVYLKRSLSLKGSAEEIYQRAAKVIGAMMAFMISHNIEPREQQGRVTTFKRRGPDESDIANLVQLHQVYDYIRMLDAQGYPRAFIETPSMRFEFERAVWRKGAVLANVKITRKTNA